MSNIPLIFWLIPVASVTALAMAWHFFRIMMQEEEGTCAAISAMRSWESVLVWI